MVGKQRISSLELYSNLYLAALYQAITLYLAVGFQGKFLAFSLKYCNFHLYLAVISIKRSWSPMTEPNSLFTLSFTCIERSLERKYLHKLWINLLREVSFWRNCGAASVGEYNRVIWYCQGVDNVDILQADVSSVSPSSERSQLLEASITFDLIFIPNLLVMLINFPLK